MSPQSVLGAEWMAPNLSVGKGRKGCHGKFFRQVDN